MRQLLGTPATLEAQTSPDLWMTLFDQPRERRYVVAALNYHVECDPGVVSPIFMLTPSSSQKVTRVMEARTGRDVSITMKDRSVIVNVESFHLFAMYLAHY